MALEKACLNCRTASFQHATHSAVIEGVVTAEVVVCCTLWLGHSLWIDCDGWSDQALMVWSVHPSSRQFLRRTARHRHHSIASSWAIANSAFSAPYFALKWPHSPSLWSWAASCSKWNSYWMECDRSSSADYCTGTGWSWSFWAEVWSCSSFASLPSGSEFLVQLRSHSWRDRMLGDLPFDSQSARQGRSSPHSFFAFSSVWVFAQRVSHPLESETDLRCLATVCRGHLLRFVIRNWILLMCSQSAEPLRTHIPHFFSYPTNFSLVWSCLPLALW